MSGMRQRQSTLPTTEGDEENIDSKASPSAPSRRGGKRKNKRQNAVLIRALLLLVGVAALSALLLLFVVPNLKSHSPSSSVPLRRALFPVQVGASTKCQKHVLLSREKLDKSVALGTTFLLNHQKPEGNFDYEYDWTTGQNDPDDAEVRQAGALWGLALIFHDQMDSLETHSPTEESQKVLKRVAAQILKGIDFWKRNSIVYSSNGMNMRHVTYPDGTNNHDTGTQALVCLSLIDFLRGLSTPQDAALAGVSARDLKDVFTLLDEMLPFLVTQHSEALNTLNERFDAYQALQQTGRDVVSSGLWYQSSQSSAKMVHWWEQHTGPWLYGFFYDRYNNHGNPSGRSSPYYDGESLLAITKAAKYLGTRYIHLWPMAAATAGSLHKRHVEDALQEDQDSDETKGVYQWLSMSLFELATVTFGEGYTEKFDLPIAIQGIYPQQEFGEWLLEMASWMVDVHKTLRKGKNTGYAYEGIVPAWTWASHVISSGITGGTELESKARKLSCTIESGISKLISWQVGMGAEANSDKWDGIMGLGGVQNAADEPGLRIDVTQHQMHAEILARRFVYAPLGGEEWPWSDVELSFEQKISN